jgi:hypothetical protein
MTTICLSHRQNEKCGLQKICQSSVKIKINNKKSSNEKFIIEMHWKFAYIYIYIILKSFKWHDCYKLLFLESPFHIKNNIFLHEFFYQSHV